MGDETGEINRRLGSIEQKLDDLPETLDRTYQRRETAALENKHLEARITTLESDKRWLWRTTAGAAIVALIAAIVAVPTALAELRAEQKSASVSDQP